MSTFLLQCHSDAKTYLCTICGKSYKSPHNLKIHMRVHTGQYKQAKGGHMRLHTGQYKQPKELHVYSHRSV